MERIREKIRKFIDNGYYPLSTITNQYGGDIVEKSIVIENGLLYLEELNCYSSIDLGMGTCRCVSHPTYVKEKIRPAEAVKLILEDIDVELDEENNIEKENVEKVRKALQNLMEEWIEE